MRTDNYCEHLCYTTVGLVYEEAEVEIATIAAETRKAAAGFRDQSDPKAEEYRECARALEAIVLDRCPLQEELFNMPITPLRTYGTRKRVVLSRAVRRDNLTSALTVAAGAALVQGSPARAQHFAAVVRALEAVQFPKLFGPTPGARTRDDGSPGTPTSA